MGKGDRVKTERSNALTRQFDDVVQQLALERDNSTRKDVVVACLVKRLGAVLADGRGWKVFLTDEEIEAMDGNLEVRRSHEAAGFILTLYKKPEPEVEEEDDAVKAE